MKATVNHMPSSWIDRHHKPPSFPQTKAFDGQEHLKTNAVFIIDSVLPHAISLIEDRRGSTSIPAGAD